MLFRKIDSQMILLINHIIFVLIYYQFCIKIPLG
jgi:hypothetical protein